jgi:hypothetical protein
VTRHVPAATIVTVVPDTVQMDGVEDPKVTARADVAVALIVNVPPTLYVLAPGSVIEIV